MSDASEFLQWQEDSRRNLTEHRPVPLEMTDTEILDWLNEWCDGYEYTYPAVMQASIFTLNCVDMKVSGASLREAVQLAAAKALEINS